MYENYDGDLVFTQKSKHIAKAKNNLAMIDWYNRLKLINLALFEWIDLPKGVKSKRIEKELYYNGCAVIANIPDVGLTLLTQYSSEFKNDYGYQLELNKIHYAVPGGSGILDDRDFVIIYNNYLEMGNFSFLRKFAQRIAECERVADVNMNNMKTPVIVTCADSEKLTVDTLLEDVDKNSGILILSHNFDVEKIKVFNLSIPYIADKVQTYKHEIINEALSFMGANTANTYKRERLINAEIEAGNDQSSISNAVGLMPRQEGCDELNEKFESILEREVKVRTSSNISLKTNPGFLDELQPGIQENNQGQGGQDNV